MKLTAYAYLYHVHKSPIVKILEYIVFFGLLVWIGLTIQSRTFSILPLFFLSCFLMVEVFYWFRVKKTTPTLTVQKNQKNVYESFTLHALDVALFSRNIKKFIQVLTAKKHVLFILKKSNIQISEIPIINIEFNDIAKKSFMITRDLDGSFVTMMDLLVAYLLLIEEKTHFLFDKHIREEDLLHILYWARTDFPQEEFPPKNRVLFWGEGFADTWTTGWTLETKKYITDITYSVLDAKPTLLGRKEEFHTLLSNLSKPTKNNVLLIGEAGTGKTSLVQALALNSALGLLPGKLYHQRVYQLMIGLLVAGVKDIGELEDRLENVMKELTHSGNVVLFIPDLENIMGSASFHLDLSGALVPYLKEGHVPIIATITPGAYKTFVEPSAVFADLFEIVHLDEPAKDEAMQMLLEKANEIEDKNHIIFTYKAVATALSMAERFMQDKALPGSAVSLLESVAASAAGAGKKVIDEADIIAKMEQKTHATIATPGTTEKDLLLHLEDKLHERIIGQEEAVNAIAQSIRRVRSGLAAQNRPISFLFLGPTGVGKTETAKALASVYFGGEDKTIRLDMSEYTGFGALNRLLGSAPGEGSEKGELTEKVYERPFSLILLDEFEKANQEVLDLFLQVLDDGRLTDNHGKKVSFANTIIIATSNAGALYIQNQLQQGKVIDASFQQGLLQELESEHIFKPELINRFDGIIVFRPLSQQDMMAIARLYLAKLQQTLASQDIIVSFDDQFVDQVSRQGFDPQFGARPLRRYIQDSIEDVIAREMLSGNVNRGSRITLRADENGKIQITQ